MQGGRLVLPSTEVRDFGFGMMNCHSFMAPTPPAPDANERCAPPKAETNSEKFDHREWKPYMGVKLVQAVPSARDGKQGYEVRYPDGYTSWSPADAFEGAYICLDKEVDVRTGKVTPVVSEATVIEFVRDAKTYFLDDEMTVVNLTTIAGHEFHDLSSRAEARSEINDIVGETVMGQQVGAMDLAERSLVGTWFCRDDLRDFLQFVLKWAKNGLSR